MLCVGNFHYSIYSYKIFLRIYALFWLLGVNLSLKNQLSYYTISFSWNKRLLKPKFLCEECSVNLYNFFFAKVTTLFLKGQMNQKIEIFSFVPLPSPNTKKNHPKWDLGKNLSSQAFRKDKRLKCEHFEDFTKTFLKWPRDGLDTTWRQCWSSGRKNILSNFCASVILGSSNLRLKAGFLLVDCVCLCRSVKVLTETEWNTRGANVCSL